MWGHLQTVSVHQGENIEQLHDSLNDCTFKNALWQLKYEAAPLKDI